jgi:L-fucose isomerase-like protein
MEKLQYEFIQDNNFAELRDNEILGQRIAMLEQVEPLVGKYVSEEYVRKKILRQTDEEIQEENKRIELEREEKLALMQKYPQLYDQSGAGPQGA